MSSRKRPPPNLLDPDSDSDTTPTTKKRPYHQKPPLPTTTTTTPPPSTTTTTHESDDEDDYMNMCIPEPTAPETLLQRQKRLAREAEERAHPKSKAELRAQEAAKREEALSQSLLTTNPTNKGLRMMRAMGFTPGSALGASTSTATTTSTTTSTTTPAARTEPIPVAIKTDRAGIGHPGKQPPPQPQPSSTEQREALLSPEEYRARVAGEQEERRREAQVLAAQKIAEGLVDGGAARRTRTLRGVNVLWRGMVLRREIKEAEARMRYELSTGLGTSISTPGDIDDGDGGAVGGAMRNVVVEDGDEELDEVVDNDEELAAFEALGAAERLQRLCEFLRGEYRYCFWCKCGYEDEAMEGCPGVEEDLHG